MVILAICFGAPAFAAAGGIALRAFLSGSAAWSGPRWVVTLSTLTLNASLGVVGFIVVKKVADVAHSDMFVSIAAALSVLEISVLEVLKELWPTEIWQKIAFQGAAALMFFMAALVWHQRGKKMKFFAIILFLLAPLAAMFRAVATAPVPPSSVEDVLASISIKTWTAFGALLLLALAAALAHKLLPVRTTA
ncbi:MAG: hypothetical protein AABO58_17775 [Acidobacteriota bacterium]